MPLGKKNKSMNTVPSSAAHSPWKSEDCPSQFMTQAQVATPTLTFPMT